MKLSYPTDAIDNGIDENLAFYSLSILNAASLFGRLIPNVRTRQWMRLHEAHFLPSSTSPTRTGP